MTNTFQLGASQKQTTVYHIYLRTHGEAHLFGEDNSGEIALNQVGQIVAAEWQQTADTFNAIHLDQWTVLPDGVRALVLVESKELSDSSSYGQVRSQLKPRVLSSFIASFKAAAAKRINLTRSLPGAPVWQQGYHEQRVDDDVTLERIRGLLQRVV
ncbi:MAG: hypothetical protein AAFZ80_12675 [Cyanobacteria bacterium P01_A01_bin.105]